jgi:hypothetical protein
MDLAAVLAWAAARARLTCASFSVDRVPLRRLDRASVQRRRPRSSACASAHRPATALHPVSGNPKQARALRVELAPPVRWVRLTIFDAPRKRGG